MNRSLPQVTRELKSKTQIARVITEGWARREMYCVACPSQNLEATTNNTRGIDFICPLCSETYQLKSSAKAFGKSLLGASYSATVEAYKQKQAPNLLLLNYSAHTVESLLLIPSFAISPSAIKQRPPLGPHARRAGWIGCTIQLEDIPQTARISILSSSFAASAKTVRDAYTKIKALERFDDALRGWSLDVLTCIQELPSRTFTLGEVYAFEPALAAKHPENQNVRAKIRQQLQILRDLGLLEFLGNGTYRLI